MHGVRELRAMFYGEDEKARWMDRRMLCKAMPATHAGCSALFLSSDHSSPLAPALPALSRIPVLCVVSDDASFSAVALAFVCVVAH